MNKFILRNGDEMPALGLGTWKSDPGVVYDVVREAIKIGYRHIDCAAFYGNEAEIGQAFVDAFDCADVKREDLWVTSKLWMTETRRTPDDRNDGCSKRDRLLLAVMQSST